MVSPIARGATRLLLAVAVVTSLVTGCGADDDPGTSGSVGASPDPTGTVAEQRHPDVVDVEVHADGDTYRFDVTISSPYDTPERYADGWRVVDADGTVYGEHTLAHDHADEQPFTRTQDGVEIPADVTEVVVEGRDSEHGYGGGTQTVPLPG